MNLVRNLNLCGEVDIVPANAMTPGRVELFDAGDASFFRSELTGEFNQPGCKVTALYGDFYIMPSKDVSAPSAIPA